jgi:protein gp37
MGDTSISWATKVWNPVTGCAKVSQGCKNCYAATIAGRFWDVQYPPNSDGTPRKFTDVRCHADRLEIPFRWKTPQRIFVNSMSDLFHKDVPDEFIRAVFSEMYRPENRKHIFMVLTKRPERMQAMINYSPDLGDHIWLGVSVEDQKAADERIPYLLQTSAAVRFVSCEPLLGPVDLTWINYQDVTLINSLNGWHGFPIPHAEGDTKISWVIAGCESGPKARPMDLDWAISLKNQCIESGTPFFFKQSMNGNKLIKEPVLDGHQWLEFPRSK